MKTLFEKNGFVTPEDDKTNIYSEFDVPSGIDKIIIDYSYSPKTVENRADAVSLISAGLEKYLGTDNRENPIDYLPVKNLITLSLDENGKYRGAAHRQDDVQHHEQQASLLAEAHLHRLHSAAADSAADEAGGKQHGAADDMAQQDGRQPPSKAQRGKVGAGEDLCDAHRRAEPDQTVFKD